MLSQKSKSRTFRLLLAGAVFAACNGLLASPAEAQLACDLNGVPQTPLLGANTLLCGEEGATSGTLQPNITAVGIGVGVIGTETSAFGASARADNRDFGSIQFDPIFAQSATALGAYAVSFGAGTLAVGDGSFVGEFDPFAGMSGGFVTGAEGGTALGSNSTVVQSFGTAVGAQAFSKNGTAIGFGATAATTTPSAANDYAVAVGNSANAGNLGAVALGSASRSSAAYSVSVGASATSTGEQSIAIGGSDSGGDAATEATAARSIAIGAFAKASVADSVAIGSGSIADHANTVSVGSAGKERKIGNVAAGTAPTDAVNVSQLQSVTGDVSAVQSTVTTHTTQITTLQTDVTDLETDLAAETTGRIAADTALDGRVGALETITANLDDRFDDVADRADAGTAVAVALSGAMFLPGKTFNLTGNVGAYRGAVAGALQIGALVSDSVALNAGVADGFNKGGKTALRAGFTFGW